MILEIFSIHNLERVGMIKTYKFAQYTEKFCGVGSFSVKVPLTEESLKYLNRNHFILFEEDTIGIIRYRKKSSDDNSIVEIKGYLSNKILEWRFLLTTKSFRGTVTDISRELVESLFINNIDSRRNISFITLSNDNKYIPDSPSSSFQATGKTTGYLIQSVLEPIGYGYSLTPILSKYNDKTSKLTNIACLEFRVHRPSNRTVENTEGNTPVLFSKEMNNLSKSEYTEDDTEFCSTAIVAGEGTGAARALVEAGDTEVSGIDRIELYVDARDLQSTVNEVTMTEEEYKKLLLSRGNSYLEDHASFTSINGTVIDGTSAYRYKRDFFNGDYVSVMDEELGVLASVQITQVTKSVTESGEKLDVTFGKDRVTIQQIIRKRGVS